MSEALKHGAEEPERLARQISQIIVRSGLSIVAQHTAKFEKGGTTLVWVLGESHLVVHLWTAEGFATVDLHVCDYQTSNSERALRLKEMLNEFCFDSADARWEELTLAQPIRTAR